MPPPLRSRTHEVCVAAPPLLLPAGAVLVRLPASGPSWATCLPVVPDAREVTVTLGRAELLPVDTGLLRDRGYRVIGAASAQRPIGDVVDLLITEELRTSAAGYWARLLADAERVFDLSLGPVQRMLHAELALHARAMASQE